MNFIQLTDQNGKKKMINAVTICQLFEHAVGCTRIIFCFEVNGDYAYEDVKESINEIFTKNVMRCMP